MQQRRVLDDQHVGREDRLAQADLVIVDAAEGDHRRAGALRAEARKRLRMAALLERGDRQHLGGGDDALAAAAVNSDLQHRVPSPAAVRRSADTSGRTCTSAHERAGRRGARCRRGPGGRRLRRPRRPVAATRREPGRAAERGSPDRDPAAVTCSASAVAAARNISSVTRRERTAIVPSPTPGKM